MAHVKNGQSVALICVLSVNSYNSGWSGSWGTLYQGYSTSSCSAISTTSPAYTVSSTMPAIDIICISATTSQFYATGCTYSCCAAPVFYSSQPNAFICIASGVSTNDNGGVFTTNWAYRADAGGTGNWAGTYFSTSTCSKKTVSGSAPRVSATTSQFYSNGCNYVVAFSDSAFYAFRCMSTGASNGNDGAGYYGSWQFAACGRSGTYSTTSSNAQGWCPGTCQKWTVSGSSICSNCK